jgi:hypothetical protein
VTQPTYHQVQQGSDEWRALRRGLITASELHLLLTPTTLKQADNPKSRSHLYELLAQRISGFVEPSFTSTDMERGHVDEAEYRRVYTEHTGLEIELAGFVTNTSLVPGCTVGCSPDGLVHGPKFFNGDPGSSGMIEGKSRRQKFQIETIIARQVPSDYVLQVQAGMLICERDWCDFISYSGGLPMFILRAYPDANVQTKIKETIVSTEQRLADMMGQYQAQVREFGYPMTERRVAEDGGYKWEVEED